MKFRIKEARERAGYSQKELAEIIGVAQNTLHGYESGKHDPKSELLSLIADACNVTVDFLLGRTVDEKETPPAISDEEQLDNELIDRLCSLTPEELEKVDAFVQGLLASH